MGLDGEQHKNNLRSLTVEEWSLCWWSSDHLRRIEALWSVQRICWRIDCFYLFEDDVDVTSDKLGDLLPLCGLNRVVTILVVSKVLRGRSSLVNTHHPGKTAPGSWAQIWAGADGANPDM